MRLLHILARVPTATEISFRVQIDKYSSAQIASRLATLIIELESSLLLGLSSIILLFGTIGGETDLLAIMLKCSRMFSM
jgi:hypothetical protein